MGFLTWRGTKDFDDRDEDLTACSAVVTSHGVRPANKTGRILQVCVLLVGQHAGQRAAGHCHARTHLHPFVELCTEMRWRLRLGSAEKEAVESRNGGSQATPGGICSGHGEKAGQPAETPANLSASSSQVPPWMLCRAGPLLGRVKSTL